MSSTKSLDLGSGLEPKNPFNAEMVFGIDLRGGASNVIKCDLNVNPIPFDNDFFNFVTAHDFIEHVPRLLYCPNLTFPFINLMSEIYRVLVKGGRFLSFTPAFPQEAAFWDPTHVNIITEQTFYMYFCNDVVARMYGFKGEFAMVEQEWRGPHLLTILEKI